MAWASSASWWCRSSSERYSRRSEPVRRRRFEAALFVSAAGWLGLPPLAFGQAPRSDVGVAPGSSLSDGPEGASERAWRALRAGEAIAVFRHAQAPGTGDPPGFRLDNCATQRNLDEAGRSQARRAGAALRARRVPVAAVWSSQWCRAVETARLMDLATVEVRPEFNSFFDDRANEAGYVQAARRALLAFSGAGNLIVVTHQVHITGLTGVFPASGEAVVLQRQGADTRLVGRIGPF